MARKVIGKKLRFEVFKRDKFTCQYCGRSAPEVILHADHIQPVSKDGETDITNLITSCQDCNLGKGDRELSDDAVIQKRKKQLDDLQERREQLEMMVEWQRGLINLGEQEVEAAIKFVNDLFSGFSLNENGEDTVRKVVHKYGLVVCLECARASADQYLERDNEGKHTQESVSKTIDCIEKIARFHKITAEKPYMRDLYYIRGIVRKRMYCNEWQAIALLEKAYLAGVDVDDLKTLAIESRNWTAWRNAMEEFTNGSE